MKIKSVADIPCGDVNWQFSSKRLNTIKVYFGADISNFVIKEDQDFYKYHLNKVFRPWDLTLCSPPRYYLKEDKYKLYDFDLVISRDVIQHLPLKKGMQLVKNVINSNIKYWAITSFTDYDSNQNIRTGQFYHNNMELAPFFLNTSIIFKQRSHFSIKHEADFFVVYKVDEKLKKIVNNYDL